MIAFSKGPYLPSSPPKKEKKNTPCSCISCTSQAARMARANRLKCDWTCLSFKQWPAVTGKQTDPKWPCPSPSLQPFPSRAAGSFSGCHSNPAVSLLAWQQRSTKSHTSASQRYFFQVVLLHAYLPFNLINFAIKNPMQSLFASEIKSSSWESCKALISIPCTVAADGSNLCSSFSWSSASPAPLMPSPPIWGSFASDTEKQSYCISEKFLVSYTYSSKAMQSCLPLNAAELGLYPSHWGESWKSCSPAFLVLMWQLCAWVHAPDPQTAEEVVV